MIRGLMRVWRTGAVGLGVALQLFWAAAAGAGERPRLLQVSGGIFDVGGSRSAAEAGLELIRPIRLWKLDLAGGVAANDEGGLWGYFGVRRDLAASERWGVAPGWGVALYEAGDGKNLGGSLQFRSSLAVDYRLTRRTRVGVTFYHLSNAGLEEINPGSNSVVATLGIALE